MRRTWDWLFSWLCHWLICVTWTYFFLSFFKRFYLFTFRERGREGGKHQCVVASCTALTGYLPRNSGIALFENWTSDPFWFTGLHSIHWTTPARAWPISSNLRWREIVLNDYKVSFTFYYSVGNFFKGSIFSFFAVYFSHLAQLPPPTNYSLCSQQNTLKTMTFNKIQVQKLNTLKTEALAKCNNQKKREL